MVRKEISYIWNGGSLLRRIYGWIIISGVILRIRMRWNSEERTRRGKEGYFRLIQVRASTIKNFREKRVYHAIRCFMLARVIYMHVRRAIWIRSLKKRRVRKSGMMVILMFMRSAFFRYVIPIRQISLWRCSVIVSLFSVIPGIREKITLILWGRYGITYLTSRRFLIVHIIMVILIGVMVGAHIITLHYYNLWRRQKMETRENNELVGGYIVKDRVTWALIRMIIRMRILKKGFINMDPDNWIERNSSVTPHNIKPEWYFLIPYAVLRSVPSKRGRAIGLLISVVWLRLLIRRGKRSKRGVKRGGNWEVISIYIIVRILIGLGRTAASREVVNMSGVCSIIRVRLLIMEL